jgi:hypothetical protein
MEEKDLSPEQQAELNNLFTYHKPFGNQPERYEQIRSAAKSLARVILISTPKSADQSAAIRKLRECVMTANAAIAINEQEPKSPCAEQAAETVPA